MPTGSDSYVPIFRALLVLLACGLWGCSREPVAKRQTDLPAEVYVWQRKWGSVVGDAIAENRKWVNTYHLLAAEMQLDQGRLQTTRIAVDKAALSGLRPGLVIRIFPSAARTGWDDAAIQTVADLAKNLIEEWPPGQVAELQLDYDCPESKLADYRSLLRSVKAAVAPVHVTCTALPSWQKQAEFAALAAEVPGYVLQVHALHLPKAPNKLVTLVDLDETHAAVKAAVKLGVPFRVAMPSYSCVVEFGDDGKVKEVYSEDVPSSLAIQSSHFAVLDADAFGMSELVATWQKQAPALLQSVIWYRLPVVGDRLNWNSEVLAKVAQGTPLHRGWKGSVQQAEGGYWEVVIEQAGEAPDDLPAQIWVSWKGASAEAADGLRAYHVRDSGPGFMRLQLSGASRIPRQAPGARWVIAWLRAQPGKGSFSVQPVAFDPELGRQNE